MFIELTIKYCIKHYFYNEKTNFQILIVILESKPLSKMNLFFNWKNY